MTAKFGIATLVAVAGFAASANAGVTLTSTGFEAPTYTAGALNGQNGWIVFGGTGTSSSNVGNVVNNAANAYAGSQYVEVNTASWTADSTSSTYRYMFGYVDNSAAFLANVGSNPIVHTRLAIRMNTQTGTRSNFALMSNFSASSGFAGLGTIGLYSPTTNVADSRVYIAGPDNAGALVISNGTTGWLNQYHVFDLYVNYNTGTISYAVDGVSLDSIIDGASYLRTFNTANAFTDCDINTERDRPSTGSSSGGATVRYDNYLVEMIPAPGAMALMGFGGLVASRRRRA